MDNFSSSSQELYECDHNENYTSDNDENDQKKQDKKKEKQLKKNFISTLYESDHYENYTPDNDENDQKKKDKKKEKQLKKNFLSNIGYQFERWNSINCQEESLNTKNKNQSTNQEPMGNSSQRKSAKRDSFKQMAKIWCCKLFKYQKLKKGGNLRDAEQRKLQVIRNQLMKILTQFDVLENGQFIDKSKFIQRIQNFIQYINSKAFVDYCYSDKQSNYNEIELLKFLGELLKDLNDFKALIQTNFQ